MMRILMIYSLNNFRIYHTAALVLVIMLFITFPVLIYLITGRLYIFGCAGQWH